MKKRALKYTVTKKISQRHVFKGKIKSIIIACEDSVSSPTYFNTFLDKLKTKGKITQNSGIIPHTGKTHPTGVLKDLMLYKTSEGKSFLDFDYRFIIIDRDKEIFHGAGHSKKDFDLAFKKAKKNKIRVIYSNPSFELWYLLHFELRVLPIDRYAVLDKVISFLKQINSEKFRNLALGNIKTHKMTKVIAKELKTYTNHALKNAKELQKIHLHKKKSLNPERDNPLTNINSLILLFEDLSK